VFVIGKLDAEFSRLDEVKCARSFHLHSSKFLEDQITQHYLSIKTFNGTKTHFLKHLIKLLASGVPLRVVSVVEELHNSINSSTCRERARLFDLCLGRSLLRISNAGLQHRSRHRTFRSTCLIASLIRTSISVWQQEINNKALCWSILYYQLKIVVSSYTLVTVHA
jgi:hypothetical protein